MKIIKYCPAKVNLFLHITGRREDGYHLLSSLMTPVNLYDILIVEKAEKGVTIDCPGYRQINQGNICEKAAEKFLQQTAIKSGLKITLFKNIPLGAGLGGGSSDAAFTLAALQEIFGNPLAADKLEHLAASIGADVPFFLHGQPAMVTGVGEKIELLDDWEKLTHLTLLLVKPNFSISTVQVYKAYRNLELTKSTGNDNKSQLRLLRSINDYCLYGNDLETVCLPKYPELVEIKDKLTQGGALKALMSGSGSAVFGIFDSQETARRQLAQFTATDKQYWTKIVKIAGASSSGKTQGFGPCIAGSSPAAPAI